jgi:hypothetical protein
MKPSIFNINLHAYRRVYVIVIMTIGMLWPAFLQAQTDTVAPEQTVAPEESGLISPSIDLISVQKNNNTIDLKASLKAKIKGSLIKLHHLKVHFFLINDTTSTELGSVNADRNGMAVFNVKNEGITAGEDGSLHFKATVSGNKSMEPGEAELTIKRALLSITPIKDDSILSVQVKLADQSTGEGLPVKDATVGIYVARMFYPLKIGEGTTDENGEITVEVPSNLPGDAKGNITLLARLDENETYGNLESSAVQAWGYKVSDKPEEQPRALWSSHPPLWMLITFIVLMTAVWGHYIVIVYELIRLRKEQPVTENGTINS